MYVYMSLILIHCQCKKFFTVNKSQTSICEFQSSYDLSQTFLMIYMDFLIDIV